MDERTPVEQTDESECPTIESYDEQDDWTFNPCGQD